jgi:hypothetical protein
MLHGRKLGRRRQSARAGGRRLVGAGAAVAGRGPDGGRGAGAQLAALVEQCGAADAAAGRAEEVASAAMAAAEGAVRDEMESAAVAKEVASALDKALGDLQARREGCCTRLHPRVPRTRPRGAGPRRPGRAGRQGRRRRPGLASRPAGGAGRGAERGRGAGGPLWTAWISVCFLAASRVRPCCIRAAAERRRCAGAPASRQRASRRTRPWPRPRLSSHVRCAPRRRCDRLLARRAAQDLDIAFGGSDKREAELLAEERDKAQTALKVRRPPEQTLS